MKQLHARDLSPIDEHLTRADEGWLRRLADSVSATDHLVRLGDAADDPEPIVSQRYDGNWRAGRYIGSITFEDRTLEIRPRLAPEHLADLLETALNVIIPTRSGRLRQSSLIVPMLLAIVWCRELDTATRHGLPFLRKEIDHEGLYVRGRLLQERSRKLRQRGKVAVASRTSYRSLDNDIAKSLVCAQRSLKRMLGSGSWMTPRAKEIMPHLWAAVGPRPDLPTLRDLRSIAYTPIRRPYRPLVEHSWGIASGRGVNAAGSGDSEGLLLDMAELWEIYVFRCVQMAAPLGQEVAHTAKATDLDQHLYTSIGEPSIRMGSLLPDVLVTEKTKPTAVFDAKYKLIVDRAEAPEGVARDDRYQLAGYLSTLEPEAIEPLLGALVFPAALDGHGRETPGAADQPSTAEEFSPWRGPGSTRAWFQRISFSPAIATKHLRNLLAGNRND